MLVLQTYGYKEQREYTTPFYRFTCFGVENNILILQTCGYEENARHWFLLQTQKSPEHYGT